MALSALTAPPRKRMLTTPTSIPATMASTTRSSTDVINVLPAVIQTEIMSYLTLFDYHACIIPLNHHWCGGHTSSSSSSAPSPWPWPLLLRPASYSFDGSDAVRWLSRVSRHRPYAIVITRAQSKEEKDRAILIKHNESLMKHWLAMAPYLHELTLHVPIVPTTLTTCSQLRSLSLTDYWYDIDVTQLITSIASMSSLQSLSLSQTGLSKNFRALIRVLPLSVTSFTVYNGDSDTTALQLLHIRLPSLTHLNIASESRWYSRDAITIANLLLQWSSLTFIGCTLKALPPPAIPIPMPPPSSSVVTSGRVLGLSQLRTIVLSAQDHSRYYFGGDDEQPIVTFLQSLAVYAPSLTAIHNIPRDSSWWPEMRRPYYDGGADNDDSNGGDTDNARFAALPSLLAASWPQLHQITWHNTSQISRQRLIRSIAPLASWLRELNLHLSYEDITWHDFCPFTQIESCSLWMHHDGYWRAHHHTLPVMARVRWYDHGLTRTHRHLECITFMDGYDDQLIPFIQSLPGVVVVVKKKKEKMEMTSDDDEKTATTTVTTDTISTTTIGADATAAITATLAVVDNNDDDANNGDGNDGDDDDVGAAISMSLVGVRLEIAGGLASVTAWTTHIPILPWSAITVNVTADMSITNDELQHLADQGCHIHHDTRSMTGDAFIHNTDNNNSTSSSNSSNGASRQKLVAYQPHDDIIISYPEK